MKERERDGRDEELLRIKAKLGEVTMANELLEHGPGPHDGGAGCRRGVCWKWPWLSPAR